MYVWTHTRSPPQHVAIIPEHEVSTSAKIRAYVERLNENRSANFKWAGIFESPRGEVTLNVFWDREAAREYIRRNAASGRAHLILASDDYP
jgi:hypothetical protein